MLISVPLVYYWHFHSLGDAAAVVLAWDPSDSLLFLDCLFSVANHR